MDAIFADGQENALRVTSPWGVFGLFFGFEFAHDAPDLGGRDVRLLGFGVNRDEDNVRLRLQVVNHAITPAFAAFHIPVWYANFENSEACPCQLVAGQFSTLQ